MLKYLSVEGTVSNKAAPLEGFYEWIGRGSHIHAVFAQNMSFLREKNPRLGVGRFIKQFSPKKSQKK